MSFKRAKNQDEGNTLSSWQIVKDLSAIVYPSMISLMLCEVVLQTNIIYVGKLNDVEEMAGMGIVYLLTNSFPISLTYGVSGVL